MIGNDIVDLQQALQESNWKRPRYLSKLFTAKEQAFIHAAPNKDQAVWLLWSRKESAYKIIARSRNQRFFAPKKLVNNNLDSPIHGQITFENETFTTHSTITNTHIHTIAQKDKNFWSLSGNYLEPQASKSFFIANKSYASQHFLARKQLLEYYAEYSKISINSLTIQKDDNKVPHLYYKNKKQPIMISMAHHGHYAGFALLYMIQTNE